MHSLQWGTVLMLSTVTASEPLCLMKTCVMSNFLSICKPVFQTTVCYNDSTRLAWIFQNGEKHTPFFYNSTGHECVVPLNSLGAQDDATLVPPQTWALFRRMCTLSAETHTYRFIYEIFDPLRALFGQQHHRWKSNHCSKRSIKANI